MKSARKGGWSLIFGTIAVCLVPLLMQVVLLLGVFYNYQQFDRFVEVQRTLRETELLTANMTTAEERAMICFTRFRITRQTADLEQIHNHLNEMSQQIQELKDTAGRYPRLLERVQPLIDSADKYRDAISKSADQMHSIDMENRPEDIFGGANFSGLLKDGLRVRKELAETHTFDLAGSDPLERFQTTLLGIFVGVCLLNFAAAGGAVFVLMRFIRKRLEHAKNNCEAILSGSSMMDEETKNAEFNELDQSLVDAQNSLSLMKQRRLAVSEGAPEVIFAMDQGLRVQMISEACGPRWGYTPEFLTQRNIVDIIHPSDATIAATMLERARTAGNTQGDLRVRHRSGMFVECRWSMKWNSGKSQAVVVSIDQTQDQMQRNMLVQQTEHQRGLIESLPVALLTASGDGIVSGASRQLYELFPRGGDAIGRRVEELFAGAERVPTWAEIQQSAQHPVEILLANEREVPLSLEVHAHPFATADKEAYLISFEDVSEKYEVERFRQELVSMVSHDLRTPLTSVSAVLEMLGVGAYGEISDKGVKAAAKAGWAASGLIQLINDLLDIERSKARRMDLDAQQVSTHELLNQAFAELEDKCYETGVELPALDQPSAQVTVDGARAKQVLKSVVEVLIQCAQPNTPLRLLTRDADGAHFDVFVGMASSRMPESEFAKLGNVYENREAFDFTGNPFTRLHIACAEELMRLMGGSVAPMTVQGTLGFVVRFQKARALANV